MLIHTVSPVMGLLVVVGMGIAVVWGAMGRAARADTATQPAAPTGQIILLKLDDVVAIAPGWQRVIDYCEKNQVKAGLGIICESLEKDDAAYVAWLKDHQKKGFIEFWCHGYYGAKDFYTTHTLEEQTAALAKCEKLAQEKLGFPLTAFGPHYSGVNADTEKAVEAVPELKVWLYGPKQSKFYTRLAIPRVMGLEYVVPKVDFDKFKADYDRVGAKPKVLVLQGHANYWDAASYEGFTKIIDFLKTKNVTFMTPSEYLKTVTPATK